MSDQETGIQAGCYTQLGSEYMPRGIQPICQSTRRDEVSDYRIVTGRRKKLEERIAELEASCDALHNYISDKNIPELEATIKRIEKHKDSKILECQCLQEVIDKNLISIKAIRELEPIFADTAVNITERVYRADELEALLPKEQP